ncbi:hypothetical protein H7142_02880 [Candidatus Saccharibacteria bacterium]|nr:hypothetical protein [Candidatus Saccharibacteria bacterium]
MEFVNREPIDELAALGMPIPEEIVINHGAALVIWGIRNERLNGDIDAATSLENNLYLEESLGFTALQMAVGISQEGKERTVVSRRDGNERFDIHRWDFSMYRYNRTKKGRMYLPELGTMSVQDPKTGIWVLKPAGVRLTMLETGRPQDEEMIPVIDDYLANTA